MKNGSGGGGRWNRRQFLKMGGMAGAAMMVPIGLESKAWGDTGVRLSGADYAAKFTAKLLRPRRINLDRLPATIGTVSEFRQQVLEGYPATRLYGYRFPGGGPTWPGATIVARANKQAQVLWRNELPRRNGPLNEIHLLPVDMTQHMPMDLEYGAIPIVTHLHGGHTESASDGQPDAWFTQDFEQRGEFFQKYIYRYANDQRGGTLWYHDHTIGMTRLNVYAGLSGMYLLRDGREESLIARGVLPDERYEVELIMQDRWFRSDGQLDLDTTPTPPGGIVLSIFADFMMVNGRPWPVMDVEPRKYRFRLLNASDSRFLVLQFDNPDAKILRIGTELGLSPQAEELDRLVIAPAERYDLVVDFSQFAGQELTLLNRGPDGAFRGFRNASGVVTNNPNDIAFGFGGPSNPNSTGMMMRFRVNQPLRKDDTGDREHHRHHDHHHHHGYWRDVSVEAGTELGLPLPKLTATNTRGVMTFNGRDDLNRGMEMQGSIQDGSLLWTDPVSEKPALGSTEIWEIYNTGPVAHPIHIHLVDFQVLDRQPFTFTAEPKPMMMHDGGTGTGARLTSVTKTGTARPPEPYEIGPKDTVIAYPNEVTRVIAKFDRPGRYVWHCHILHHEDHDMMRPYEVVGWEGGGHGHGDWHDRNDDHGHDRDGDDDLDRSHDRHDPH